MFIQIHQILKIIKNIDSFMEVQKMTDKEKMIKLINYFNEVVVEENICESEIDNFEDGCEYDFYVKWPDEDVRDEVDNICCELFILNNGIPNYENIRTFNNMQSDFEVGPGERDSFGWLTGVVTTDRNICLVVVFG